MTRRGSPEPIAYRLRRISIPPLRVRGIEARKERNAAPKATDFL